MTPLRDIPVNLVTGWLGAGKTSAIRALIAAKPAAERWAVLVNEFGEIRLDGAAFAGGDVVVREVPGGCLCCTAQMGLRLALTDVLRRARPQRVLIEPAALGHAVAVVDALRSPWLAGVVDVRSTLCLVDPAQYADPRIGGSDAFREQVALADVVIVSKVDAAAPQAIAAVRDLIATMPPRRRSVVEWHGGALDLALLDPAGGAATLT